MGGKKKCDTKWEISVAPARMAHSPIETYPSPNVNLGGPRTRVCSFSIGRYEIAVRAGIEPTRNEAVGAGAGS